MPSKFTLVSNPGPHLFHLKYTVVGIPAPTTRRIATAFILIGCLLCLRPCAGARVSPAIPGPDRSGSLYEPVHDSAILRALDHVYRAEYGAADSVLSSLPDCPARAYFRGLARVNRFGDLGDTASLFAARALWERLDRASDSAASPLLRDPNYPLYRGLSELQLSYVASITGGRLHAARLGRKAVGLLRPYSDRAEAAAALALYDYYKAALLKGVAWLPFVDADKDRPLRRLEAVVPRSRYLGDIFRTSLIWIHYDAARYEEGLRPIQAFLARYPGNRVYRQMLADFRYRQGDLDSARRIHEILLSEYEDLGKNCPARTCLPLGYLSSVGNLAKLDASQKRPDSLERHLAIWHSPGYGDIMKWLPASLVREVSLLEK
ncbi:MAG TPA: hypothetical protein VJ385_01730 [Fibrobacteria bacterium]|nr:hypothetical protein [Fibrobacteria bacterium]